MMKTPKIYFPVPFDKPMVRTPYFENTYQNEEDGGATAVAAAALGFDVLKSSLSAFSKGDLEVVMPAGSIGVIATNLPKSISSRLQTYHSRKTVFKYRKANWITDLEQVNIQLVCRLQYNGPSVQATFGFAAGGTRSRLLRDSKVTIRNPLSLERRVAPKVWRDIGLSHYPVVTIPIEVYVDHPWPQSNDHWTFDLVISGMHGFGRQRGESHIQNKVHVEN